MIKKFVTLCLTSVLWSWAAASAATIAFDGNATGSGFSLSSPETVSLEFTGTFDVDETCLQQAACLVEGGAVASYSTNLSLPSDAVVEFRLFYIAASQQFQFQVGLSPVASLSTDPNDFIAFFVIQPISGSDLFDALIDGTSADTAGFFRPRDANGAEIASNFNGSMNFALATDVAPVPLPAAAWFFLTALLGAGWFRRRQNTSRATDIT